MLLPVCLAAFFKAASKISRCPVFIIIIFIQAVHRAHPGGAAYLQLRDHPLELVRICCSSLTHKEAGAMF